MRGVLNDALSIYFLDPTLASAFVARWCAGYKVETAEGVFSVCADEAMLRVGAGYHPTAWLGSRLRSYSLMIANEPRYVVRG